MARPWHLALTLACAAVVAHVGGAGASTATVLEAAATSTTSVQGQALPLSLVRAEDPVRGKRSASYRFSGQLVEVADNTYGTTTVCRVSAYDRRQTLVRVDEDWTVSRMGAQGADDGTTVSVDFRVGPRGSWRRVTGYEHDLSGAFDPFVVTHFLLTSWLQAELPRTFELRVRTSSRLTATALDFENALAVTC